MLFNSLSFFIFFALFFVGYWALQKQLKIQNLLLLIASYVFYAWADWRFLPYLVGVSLLNYLLGIGIEKTENPKLKRLYVWIGLIQGIGALAFFKYYNFFVESFKKMGAHPVTPRWNKNMAEVLQTDAKGDIIFIPLPMAFSFGEFKE